MIEVRNIKDWLSEQASTRSYIVYEVYNVLEAVENLERDFPGETILIVYPAKYKGTHAISAEAHIVTKYSDLLEKTIMVGLYYDVFMRP